VQKPHEPHAAFVHCAKPRDKMKNCEYCNVRLSKNEFEKIDNDIRTFAKSFKLRSMVDVKNPYCT
jgi:hypothetical protein